MNENVHVIEVCYGGSVIRTISCDDFNSDLKSYSRSELSRYILEELRVSDNAKESMILCNHFNGEWKFCSK